MFVHRRTKSWTLALVCAPVMLLMISGALAEEAQVDLQAFRPQWKVGQKWVVETVTRQTQARRAPRPAPMAKRLRWQFEVRAVESCEGQDCFRLQISPLLPGRQPQTTLWVDQQSITLRRVRMEMPTADGLRTIEETYHSSSGQPFPAMAATRVPPVELPVFLSGTKGKTSFQYEAFSGPSQAKAVGDVGFGSAVEQMVVPQPDDYPSLFPTDRAKDLQKRPKVEVRLKSARDQVRQVWQAGLPWPVFSDNGYAQSLLVPESDQALESQN